MDDSLVFNTVVAGLPGGTISVELEELCLVCLKPQLYVDAEGMCSKCWNEMHDEPWPDDEPSLTAGDDE